MNLDRKIQNLQVKEIIWMQGDYSKNDFTAVNHKYQDETYIVTYAPTSLIFKMPIKKLKENFNLTRFICIDIYKKEIENEKVKTTRSRNY